MVIVLSSYKNKIEHRSTTENANADFCSRLPPKQTAVTNTERVPSMDAFYEQQLETLPVTAEIIKRYTRTDQELSQVLDFTLSGWQTVVTDELKPYHNRRNEMSVS